MALARPPPLEELSKELLSVDEEGCAEDDEAVEDAEAEAEDKVVEFVFFADLSNFCFSSINFSFSFSSLKASTRSLSCSASNLRLSS